MSAAREARPVARVWVAGAGEAAAVAGLMCEFRDWQGRTEPSGASVQGSVERLIGDSASAEYLLGAVDGGVEPAAVCQLRYRYGLWYAAEDCWLEDLYVREPARRSGLGATLVEAALERASARGCRRIELDVDSDNFGALAFYRRLGFSAETPSGADRLMMRLPLSAAASTG